MKRSITRTKGDRYCTVEISIEGGQLGVCGSEGRIVSRADAKKEALQYWTSFFEESPEEMLAMGKRFNRRFRSEASAARFVLAKDGELHGLDVERIEGDNVCLCLLSCGQIWDTIEEFFPEAAPLLPWHLNHMNAGCIHQEAMGWGRGKIIALDASSCTEAQRATFAANSLRQCEAKREKEFQKVWTNLCSDRNERVRWIRSQNDGKCSVEQDNLFAVSYPGRRTHNQRVLREQINASIQPTPFEAAIFKDSLGCPCPECGYEYGTRWLKRELPVEIVKLAEEIGKFDDEQVPK